MTRKSSSWPREQGFLSQCRRRNKLRAIEKMWFPSFNRVECLDGQIKTTRGLGYEGRGYLSDEDCEYKWNEKLIALCGALAATCFMTNDSDSDDTNSGWDSYEPPTPEPDENDHEPIEDTLRSERSPIPSPRSPTPSLTWGVSSRFGRNENRLPRPKRDDLPTIPIMTSSLGCVRANPMKL